MSISAAFNSALSGLTAAKRASQVVSENIANAMTPGYTRRSVELGSTTHTGSGVKVVGIQRHTDPGITANRRGADASAGGAKTIAEFHNRFQALLGDPTDAASVTQRLAKFESSLISAASRPDSTQRLDIAVDSAADLAKSIAGASDGLRGLRSQADREIGAQVNRLNAALEQTHALNKKITAAAASGHSTDALLDQRQKIVDEINSIVPVNVVSRDHGKIALYTDGGAIILDGPAASFGFEAARDAPAHMTQDNGDLSGLTLNGMPLRTDASGPVGGGTLGALFEVRDELAPQAQSDLDTVARDLMERYESADLDPPLPPDPPGLFIDAGAPVASSAGLAGRLRLNPQVDPEAGGQTWRLRTGLGTTTPGDAGDARQLQAFADVLTVRRSPSSGNFGSGQFSAADLSGSLLSYATQRSSSADQSLGFASAAQTEFTRIEQEQGVDTDAELQTLMTIEHAYGANARMIQALDDMMTTLLRL